MVTAAEQLESVWAAPRGIVGWFSVVNHKQIGIRYMVTSFAFFLAGGVMALLMRTQLFQAENTFLAPDTYNQLFTMHGTTMMFLFAVPFLEGLGSYLIPLMLGSRELAFPRLNAFGYWAFLLGGLLLYSSFLLGAAPDGGWFAYVPLSGPAFSPGLNLDFWLLGLTLVEIATIVATIDLTTTIFTLRAPGMALNRMPLMAWAILGMSFMVIFAFPPLVVASAMLELDRSIGTVFFDPNAGGSALLWQHLFWVFGHPEVYIQLLPAIGVVVSVIPTFARRALIGYPFVALALTAIAVLSLGLWVHHMFAVGLPLLALNFFTAASMTIAIPSGIMIFSEIATIWNGRPRWTAPMLFAIGFIVIFVLGGMTGVMVSIVPFDWQVHDTYFVVAHFHYTLIGGVVFPIFAALHYWFPKITGRLLSEWLGIAAFVLMFVGFNVAFFPMHITGLLGMPRRVYTYQQSAGLEGLNQIQTIGAFVLGLGVLVFLINALLSFRRPTIAGPNPWDAFTLEWATTSPPASYNFAAFLTVSTRSPLRDRPAGTGTDVPASLRGSRKETLGTSALDAVPSEIVWLPHASLVPLILALGLTAALVGVLLRMPIVIGLGAVVSAGAAFAWARPNPAERDSWPDEQAIGKPIPVHGPGESANSTWGMILLVATGAATVVSLIASYVYLMSGAPSWPPEGISRPALALPTVGAVLIAVSIAFMVIAGRGRRALGLGATALLGIAGTALPASGINWTDPNVGTHAYNSLLFTVGTFQILLTLTGVALLLYVLARVRQWKEPRDRYPQQAVHKAAIYWYFVAGSSLAAFLTLYVAPYLT